MNQKTLKFAASMIVALVLFNTFSVVAFSKKDPTTPILINPFPSIPEDAPRTPSAVRIEASFDSGENVINVWLRNAGTSVTVDIENVSTGASYQYSVSGDGSDVLPISGASGYWTITFTLSDGSVYAGNFMI